MRKIDNMKVRIILKAMLAGERDIETIAKKVAEYINVDEGFCHIIVRNEIEELINKGWIERKTFLYFKKDSLELTEKGLYVKDSNIDLEDELMVQMYGLENL